MPLINIIFSRLFSSYRQSYQLVSKHGWHVIFVRLAQSLATGLAFYLSIYLVSTLHYSIVSAGIVLSCYGIGTMIGGVVGGKLSDRTAPHKVVIMSLLFESVLFTALPYFTDLHIIMLITALLGISAYMFKTANTIQLINTSSSSDNNSRLTAINILYTASNIGIGTSALLIGLLAHLGFAYLFYAGGILTLLLAIYQIIYLSNTETNKTADKRPNAQQSAHQNKKIFLTVLLSLFITGLIIAQLRTTYSIYIHHLFPQFGMHGLGLLLVLNPALIILFQTPLTNAIMARIF